MPWCLFSGSDTLTLKWVKKMLIPFRFLLLKHHNKSSNAQQFQINWQYFLKKHLECRKSIKNPSLMKWKSILRVLPMQMCVYFADSIICILYAEHIISIVSYYISIPEVLLECFLLKNTSVLFSLVILAWHENPT